MRDAVSGARRLAVGLLSASGRVPTYCELRRSVKGIHRTACAMRARRKDGQVAACLGALMAADVAPSGDDHDGGSLADPADSASAGEAGGDGGIGAEGLTMTENDLGGRLLVRALVRAQVQAVEQGVAECRGAGLGL